MMVDESMIVTTTVFIMVCKIRILKTKNEKGGKLANISKIVACVIFSLSHNFWILCVFVRSKLLKRDHVIIVYVNMYTAISMFVVCVLNSIHDVCDIEE